MTFYQKAIKLKEQCENQECCAFCKYFLYCRDSKILIYIPSDEKLETLSKAIKEEKWDVK